jgi:hypothetical protein
VRECSRVNPVADGLRVEPQHLGDLRDRQQLILPPLTDYRPSPPWIEHCRPSGTCRTPSTASTSAEHRAGRWAVKGAPSGVREAQAEGPTLTGATPMRPSWRVRKGSLSMSGSRARSARYGGPQRSRRRARLAPESAEPRLCLRQRHRPPLERSTVRSSLSGRKSGGVACSSKWRPWGPTWTSYPSRNYFGSVETSCVSSGRAGSSAAATPRRATTPSFSLNGSPTANLRRTLKRAGT